MPRPKVFATRWITHNRVRVQIEVGTTSITLELLPKQARRLAMYLLEWALQAERTPRKRAVGSDDDA